jgi:DNA modification methylase
MTKNNIEHDPRNANKGTERGKELLLQSVRELGGGRSVLLDKNGTLIAGNKTFDAAQEAGLKVRVIEAGRGELIAVRRADLDLSDDSGEARRLAYLDNRVGELDLEWDASVVAADAAAGLDLDALGFLDKELQGLLAQVDLQIEEEKTDPAELIDKANELVQKWKVELGQIWMLGNHRLLIGDCTEMSAIERLMGGEMAQICWTDPPWNVAYGENLQKENPQGYKKRKMKNDNLGEKFPAFIQAAVKTIWQMCEPGALIYLVMSAQEWPVIDKALRDQGYHWSSTIIWMKDQLVLSRKDYHTQFEPIWYGWKESAARIRSVMDRKQSDVWQIDRPKRSDDHPTMKPLQLVERSLINSSLPGDIVFDPFVGSGTTLIVCEQLGRKCRAVELDPDYAAVVIERWAQFTGLQPELLAHDAGN